MLGLYHYHYSYFLLEAALLFLFSTTTATELFFAEAFLAKPLTKQIQIHTRALDTTQPSETNGSVLLSSVSENNEPTLSKMDSKLETVQSLFQKHFGDVDANVDSDGTTTTSAIAVAPGRVNLIGEHTDYTGGFVLPFAIDYSTVVYGRGRIIVDSGSGSSSDNNQRRAKLSFVSALTPESLEVMECSESSSVPPPPVEWTSYVLGTVFQYLPDLPEGAALELEFCISGDVPLGSGLSSSASLEVAVARFVEAVLGDHAFSSEPNKNGDDDDDSVFSPSKIRALRCQKAENEWCHSPCGIMDQAISSAARSGGLLLIDCRTLDFVPTKMAETSLVPEDPMPVLVVANSNVQHSIGGGEYPVRVAQCKAATEALQKTNPDITSLRDATPEDVEAALESDAFSDRVSYLRAKHVATENERTLRAREDLEAGDWASVGALMNASHSSMRDDYEVSCEEVDILVGIAQEFPGVYGSRLTGGGFGGCTVTLVAEDRSGELVEHMQTEYKAATGLDCPCFVVTLPARGAHLLSFTDHKPLVAE